jgi:hypothetical protein
MSRVRANPTSDRVTAALARPCGMCHAEPEQPCRNVAADGGRLPDRVVHAARRTP